LKFNLKKRELLSSIFRIIDNDCLKNTYDLMRDLISLESHSQKDGCEEAVAYYIRDYLQNIGCTVEIREVSLGRPNVIASLGNEKESPVLMFNAHTDTVPAVNWIEGNPYKAVMKDGKIYGRGAADMKGPIVSCLFAITALARVVGNSLKGRIVFTGVVGEEGSGSIGTYEILENGPIPDYVIVCEPTNLDIAVAQKGSVTFTISFQGLASHSSEPNVGINAIELVSDFIQTDMFMQEFSYYQGDFLTPTTIVPVEVKGGGRNDTVPDECIIKLNCRYPAGINVRDILNYLDRRAKKVCEKKQKCGYKISILTRKLEWKLKKEKIFNPLPFKTSPDSLLVRKLKNSAFQLNGINPEVIGVNFWSDAGLFGGIAKIPTVIFGPGNIKVAHGPNEYIEISQMICAAKIFASTALNICLP